MNKISCEICQDLIPMVQDGIASDDSTQAVSEHLKCCSSCSAIFDGITIPESDSKRAFHQFKRKLRGFFGIVLMLGLLFGLALSGGGEMFYNILLMPIIGALGYALVGWSAAYKIPVLLFATYFMMNLIGIAWRAETLDFISLAVYSLIYAGLAVLGTVIAGLLHFALRKEK